MKVISRNQPRAGLWQVRAWFNNKRLETYLKTLIAAHINGVLPSLSTSSMTYNLKDSLHT